MKKLSVFLALISLSIFFIFSCQKDNSPYQAGDSNNLSTTIAGRVTDESNAPLSGVTVSGYGHTTTTNQYGTFVLKNLFVNKDRCVLKFSKAGFFNRTHGFIASGNTVNYVHILLMSDVSAANFSSSAVMTVYLGDGSSVLFQPNSFVTSNGTAYNGMVNIAIKHLSPDDANFGFMIPGGDLLGKDLDDKDVALYSYGMLGVELKGSSGEALQLAAGTTATLTMIIAPSQLSSAPASIPLWYFDETTSLWKEEGSATKVNNTYIGTVKHFSWWNCDYYGPKAFIKGKVVDCQGNGIPNVLVSVNIYHTLTTNQNGEYQKWVPAGMTLTVQVIANNNTWLTQNSLVENVPALLQNQVFSIPDLTIQCPTRIKGLIKSCVGEVTDGIIFLTDNSTFNIYQYTPDGNFNLFAIPNAQIDLNAYNSTSIYHQTITSLSAPNILNVGNLLLCNLSSTLPNNFTIDGSGFSDRLFNIFASQAIGQVGWPPIVINISGTATPDYQIQFFNIWIMDTIPGAYPLDQSIGNQTWCSMSNPGNSYILGTQIGSTGTLNLIQVDAVGGRIKGNFSGTGCMTVNNGSCDPIVLSGNFDVLRTQ